MPRLVHTDRCLLRDAAILRLASPDAAGLLERRSNLSGWYKYWFSLSGSQLLYFERGQSNRRALLVATISLFRHKLSIVNTIKRRREFEILDAAGKLHILRAGSDAEMHWWVQMFTIARNKIPPAKPIAPPLVTSDPAAMPTTAVDSHLKVDHVLCVVHGIGVSASTLARNIRQLRETYTEIMEKVFPDVDFRVEMLVIHWREALMNLDVHKRLHAVVPRDPVGDEANPLRQFMVHRIVDYVYYTHDRYRRHILREVTRQLNEQMENFRKRRPDFNGMISVMGHSLGAALCYDLMCRKVHDDQALLESEGMRLNFEAANLFCVGNPLGTFLGLDPTIGLGADMETLPFRIFNIFKTQDPVATRLEPHKDIANANVPPVVVPCWFNMGLRETTSQWLGGLWPGQKKKEDGSSSPTGVNGSASPNSAKAVDVSGEVSEKGSSGPPSLEGVLRECGSDEVYQLVEDGNDGVRLDFALQMSSTMEEMSTSWSALKAHTDYWGNRDAMLFMVSRMVKSTFGIGDDDIECDTDARVIDEDVLWKRRGELDMRTWDNDGAQEDIELGDVVKQVVERLVDEAVANYELVKLHPDVRTRFGGVAGRSPVVSKTEIGESGRGSWTDYLRSGWFGGSDGSGKK